MNEPEIICCPKKQEIFSFSYKDFFNTFGAGLGTSIELGEKPVVISSTEINSENFTSLEDTQYAMAA